MLILRRKFFSGYQEENDEIPAQHHCSIHCAWVSQPCNDSLVPMIATSGMSIYAKYEARQKKKTFRTR